MSHVRSAQADIHISCKISGLRLRGNDWVCNISNLNEDRSYRKIMSRNIRKEDYDREKKTHKL